MPSSLAENISQQFFLVQTDAYADVCLKVTPHGVARNLDLMRPRQPRKARAGAHEQLRNGAAALPR